MFDTSGESHASTISNMFSTLSILIEKAQSPLREMCIRFLEHVLLAFLHTKHHDSVYSRFYELFNSFKNNSYRIVILRVRYINVTFAPNQILIFYLRHLNTQRYYQKSQPMSSHEISTQVCSKNTPAIADQARDRLNERARSLMRSTDHLRHRLRCYTALPCKICCTGRFLKAELPRPHH